MKRIKSNYHTLQVLKSAKPKLKRAIIQNSDKELIHAINECALNVLRGNCPLSTCNKIKLRKHRRSLRKVTDKAIPLVTKKKVIIQRGGFLIPLLTAVLPTIASLLFRRGDKK
jgi:hypothetical protein